MKKQVSSIVILVALLVVLVSTVNGCSVTTSQMTATVPGPDSKLITESAKAADQAIADLTQSTDISVPSTIESTKLLIGSETAYPPLEFLAYVTSTNDKGEEARPKTAEMVGFEIDLCRAVAKKLGLEPSFFKVELSDVSSSLAEGKVDIMASGMVTGEQPTAELASTDTYLAADLAICTQTGAKLTDEASLKNKLVGVQTGSPSESVVTAIEGLTQAPRPYPQILTAFADLAAGKVDAVVVERPIAQWILSKHADYLTTLEVGGTIETGQGYAFWCGKDKTELLAAVNAALAELRQVPAVAATTTTVAAAGGTTTTVTAQPAKSVYQLICDKWGLTGK